jgi:type IV secretion system protein VirB2
MLRFVKRLAAVPAALALSTAAALASTGGGGSMPWDTPLESIESDLQGTVAHLMIIIAIVATGLMFAFGEHGSSMRKIMGIAAGGSVALLAPAFSNDLGFGSGAVGGAAATDWATVTMFGVSAALVLIGLTLGALAGGAPKKAEV